MRHGTGRLAGGRRALRALLLLCAVSLALPVAAQTREEPPAPVTSSERDRSRRAEALRLPPDVALYSSRRVKYVVAGPPATAEVARAELEAAGARLLSFRDLPALDRRLMVFDFGRQLDLDGARGRLRRATTGHRADFDHLYRFAEGPRLYAPALVGGGVGGCRAGGTIGVIDGQVDPSHPALRAANVTTTSSLVPGQVPVGADHGTAVAALLVGEDASGALAGFAQGARLLAVSAFAEESGGVAADVDRIAGALDWLLQARAGIVNMSFAGPQNRVLEDLLDQAAARGVVMVAAAGNDGRGSAAFPASHPAVIAVTAVDAGMRRYRNANRGRDIEFAAPGVDIYVAKGGGGGYASGTSYAAPIVTALAARRGAGSLEATRRALQTGVLDLGDTGRDSDYGWGLVRDGGC